MADDEDDRQPPQSYDTVAPAGVGAASGNQMSISAFQDLYMTGDQGLLDVAMEEIHPDALSQFLSSLPSPRTVREWPGSPLTPASNAATPRGSWTSGSPPPRTLRQADLQRRLRMMLQDQEQLAQGREIANVTMTNSIVTSYKQGGAPSVQTSSSWVSP